MKYSRKVGNYVNKMLVLLVIIFALLIIKKASPKVSYAIKKNIFEKSISFININKFTKKIIGKDVFYSSNNHDASLVFKDDSHFQQAKPYFNGEEFSVSSNLPIGTIESGVVVYIGSKDNFNKTVIIQGVDGYNIWYGNLKNVNVKLYDYIEKSSLIGEADGEKIYLLIEKDNNFYTYEKYSKNKD